MFPERNIKLLAQAIQSANRGNAEASPRGLQAAPAGLPNQDKASLSGPQDVLGSAARALSGKATCGGHHGITQAAGVAGVLRLEAEKSALDGQSAAGTVRRWSGRPGGPIRMAPAPAADCVSTCRCLVFQRLHHVGDTLQCFGSRPDRQLDSSPDTRKIQEAGTPKSASCAAGPGSHLRSQNCGGGTAPCHTWAMRQGRPNRRWAGDRWDSSVSWEMAQGFNCQGMGHGTGKGCMPLSKHEGGRQVLLVAVLAGGPHKA